MTIKSIGNTNGWIAGMFEGAMIMTDSFEVGMKTGEAHCAEPVHYHTSSVEHTFIVEGECYVRHEGGATNKLSAGDMISIDAGEVVVWEWLSNWRTLVIRTPKITRDKVILS